MRNIKISELGVMIDGTVVNLNDYTIKPLGNTKDIAFWNSLIDNPYRIDEVKEFSSERRMNALHEFFLKIEGKVPLPEKFQAVYRITDDYQGLKYKLESIEAASASDEYSIDLSKGLGVSGRATFYFISNDPFTIPLHIKEEVDRAVEVKREEIEKEWQRRKQLLNDKPLEIIGSIKEEIKGNTSLQLFEGDDIWDTKVCLVVNGKLISTMSALEYAEKSFNNLYEEFKSI